jgi:hypothetical protein
LSTSAPFGQTAPFGPADVAAFLDGLAARGLVVTVGPRGGLLAPGAERHERAFIRANKAAVLAELRRRTPAAPKPAPPARPRKPQEPEPTVFAWRGRRVTEDDVLACLRGFGDQSVEDYRTGELTKADAFQMTRVWLREREELRPR